MRQQAIEQGRLRTDLLGAQTSQALSPESQLANQQQQSQQIATSYATALRPLLNNPQALLSELQRQKQQFQSAGVDTAGIDEDIIQLQTPEGLALLAQEVNDTLTPAGSLAKSAGQREFENFVNIAQNPNSTQLEKDSANRALGNLAKVSTSAAERIASSPDLADAIAVVEGKKSTATEAGKLKSQLKFKPKIIKASKLAEKAAAERGEVLTDLARMEATLPGLLEVTSELKELAAIATSTLGGKAYDAIVKQSGFGATKGSTARAKFIAIIDNQVLPLLKPTFGGSFTVGEGDALRATLGDPDATLEAKVAQINAFIAQKERDIRSKQTQITAGDADFNNISDEDLFK